MNSGTALAIGGGLLSGLLFLSALGGPAFILLQYVAQLPLFAVGLALGLGPVVIAGAVASALTLVVDVVSGLVFVLVYGLPVLLVVRQALLNRAGSAGVEWYPPGLLLAAITGYAAMGLALAAVVLSGQESGMAGAVVRLIQQTAEALTDGQVGPELTETLTQYAFLLPALIGVSWICMVAINAVLAQNLLANLGRNLRPSPRYADIRLPIWPAYALGGAAVLWLIAGANNFGFAAAARLIVLMTPFFLQGLAVVHVLARRAGWILALSSSSPLS